MSAMTDWLFIQARFTLVSPLSIGSGETDKTDHDILLDDEGVPFVPATSLAGVLRRAVGNKDTADKLFGRQVGEETRKSLLSLSDGRFLSPETVRIVERDGVGLDEHRTPENTAKYDAQAVDAGAVFDCDMEIRLFDDSELDADACLRALEAALYALDSGQARIGYKTSRGFGRVKTALRTRRFSAAASANGTSASPLRGALAFMWDDAADDGWHAPSAMGDADRVWHEIKLEGGFDGPVSVREYVVGGDTHTDFQPTTMNGRPVLPGTSVAGVVKSQCRRLLGALGADEAARTALLNEMFGDTTALSACRTDEAPIEGGTRKEITRVKIDRLTGGAADGALYTECAQIGGTATLCVMTPADETRAWMTGLALLAMYDLRNGLGAFGGGASVGHGLLTQDARVTLDGCAVSPHEGDSNYLCALAAKLADAKRGGGAYHE